MVKEPKVIVHRIAVGEARKRQKQLLFVDARSATALARNPGQIPGAIHIPLKNLAESAKSLPGDRVIVTYCT